jgi:hypothetical protein
MNKILRISGFPALDTHRLLPVRGQVFANRDDSISHGYTRMKHG